MHFDIGWQFGVEDDARAATLANIRYSLIIQKFSFVVGIRRYSEKGFLEKGTSTKSVHFLGANTKRFAF